MTLRLSSHKLSPGLEVPFFSADFGMLFSTEDSLSDDEEILSDDEESSLDDKELSLWLSLTFNFRCGFVAVGFFWYCLKGSSSWLWDLHSKDRVSYKCYGLIESEF